MLLSLIIPTSNSSKTLVRCIESIISQTHTNFDIWLIDNVSTDHTLSIIKEYQLKYPFINYISEPDKGIYDAMNKGINIAGGDWLYFLGSDDTLFDNEVLSLVAEKIKTVDAEVIYGSVMIRGENQWNLDNLVFDGEYTFEKFIDSNICHQAMFYKRSLVKRIGYFNLKYITSADFDFNLRCYANARFSFIDRIIANFCVGGQSTMTEDIEFKKDRGTLLMRYYGNKIFSPVFKNARLYLQQAALSASSPLSLQERIYCLSAYIKLKAMSMISSHNH